MGAAGRRRTPVVIGQPKNTGLVAFFAARFSFA
jgi:hypothetical protein